MIRTEESEVAYHVLVARMNFLEEIDVFPVSCLYYLRLRDYEAFLRFNWEKYGV